MWIQIIKSVKFNKLLEGKNNHLWIIICEKLSGVQEIYKGVNIMRKKTQDLEGRFESPYIKITVIQKAKKKKVEIRKGNSLSHFWWKFPWVEESPDSLDWLSPSSLASRLHEGEQRTSQAYSSNIPKLWRYREISQVARKKNKCIQLKNICICVTPGSLSGILEAMKQGNSNYRNSQQEKTTAYSYQDITHLMWQK